MLEETMSDIQQNRAEPVVIPKQAKVGMFGKFKNMISGKKKTSPNEKEKATDRQTVPLPLNFSDTELFSSPTEDDLGGS